MARNRMIKPEFWEDYKFAECSTSARLLFLAMLNFADDEGYLEHSCKWLKAKCLPYDDVEISPLLDELFKIERIVANNNVIWIKNFLKHQRIDRPNPSNLSDKFNSSTNDRRVVDEPSPPKDKISKDKISKDKISKDKISKDKLKEVKEISTKVDEQAREKEIILPLEGSRKETPKPHGNQEVNKMLEALKVKVGVQAFVDSSIERNMAKHCVGLMGKIGRDEFVRRLDYLLEDGFHSKNCNKIKYIYNNIKGFIEPKQPNYIQV